MAFDPNRYGFTGQNGSRYYTIADIQRANADAGRYFFQAEAMRFFGSRLCGEPFNGPGGVFFVTSERRPHSTEARRYTVRRFLPATGDIDSAGPFQAHATAATAKRHAKRLANDRDVRGGHDCRHDGMTGLPVCLICQERLSKGGA